MSLTLREKALCATVVDVRHVALTQTLYVKIFYLSTLNSGSTNLRAYKNDRYSMLHISKSAHESTGFRPWVKSYNYGKQSRVRDWTFGTLGSREKSDESNVGYVNTVWFPLF